LFAIIFGFVFGVVTVLTGVSKMLALKIGPMYITILIATSSMIIPTVAGTFFPGADKLSFYKLIAILLLIFFIFITTFKKSDKSFSMKWLFLCVFMFIFGGLIGVLQKIFRITQYGDQTSAFLAAAFFASFAYSLVMMKVKAKGNKVYVSKRLYVFGVLCGICAYLSNHINLYLSGILSSQLFFPLVNGIPLIACSIIAFTFFKEKFSKLQLLGLVGGIASLIAICLVP
jgi:drug/metabolite transporter (DMT)-like permease